MLAQCVATIGNPHQYIRSYVVTTPNGTKPNNIIYKHILFYMNT